MSLVVMYAGCKNNDNAKQNITINFWHFWSEPHQKQALEDIIEEYERIHPGIDIVTNPLQWSDGKTSLLLAFSSNSTPDLVHLGLEWAHEFIYAGVLSPISIDIDTTIPSQIVKSITDSTQALYCLPWTMNTRALILTHSLAKQSISDSVTFETLLPLLNKQSLWASNSAEPHTLLKKSLPVLWSKGSILFTKLPFSSTFDQQAIDGLSLYVQLSKLGRLEQSRLLDQYLVKGTIQASITGQWILPSLKNIPHKVLPKIPGVSGASILSGDCIGLSKQSANKQHALEFARYISSFEQAKKLCIRISDAGIPASTISFLDNDFLTDPDIAAFTNVCQYSRVLPSPKYFLDAETILENCIMKAIYGEQSPEQALSEAKSLIIQLELQNQ